MAGILPTTEFLYFRFLSPKSALDVRRYIYRSDVRRFCLRICRSEASTLRMNIFIFFAVRFDCRHLRVRPKTKRVIGIYKDKETASPSCQGIPWSAFCRPRNFCIFVFYRRPATDDVRLYALLVAVRRFCLRVKPKNVLSPLRSEKTTNAAIPGFRRSRNAAMTYGGEGYSRGA